MMKLRSEKNSKHVLLRLFCLPPTHLLQSPVDLLRRQEMRECLWSLTEATTATVHLINIVLVVLQGHSKKYFLKLTRLLLAGYSQRFIYVEKSERLQV